MGRCALGRRDGQTAPELGRAPERPPERDRTRAFPKVLTVRQKRNQPLLEAARAGGDTEQSPWGGLDARGNRSTRPTAAPRAWLSCAASGVFHDWLRVLISKVGTDLLVLQRRRRGCALFTNRPTSTTSAEHLWLSL